MGLGHGAYFGPSAEQIQHQVHLMNAVTHCRAAALAGPGAAPGNGVVGGVPVPGGLAVDDTGLAEFAAGEQFAGVDGAGAEAVLEENGRVGPACLLPFPLP
jgi:hypothetical protein